MCGRRKSCHNCGGANRDPDTMRHGGFPYEVRGSDHAASTVHSSVSLTRAPTNHNPLTNQSESGAALSSMQGLVMRSNASRIVRQMGPLYYDGGGGFRGNVGVTLVPQVRNNSLPLLTGYDGILPIDQQPLINKPYPYGG